MTKFNLFDQVKLTEPVALTGFMSNAQTPLDVAPIGMVGTIVEILEPDEAFLVEFFGDWVTLGSSGEFLPAEAEDEVAFQETVGVDTVYAHQAELLPPYNNTKVSLFQLLDRMPENLLEEVKTFAESLSSRR